MKLCKYKGQTYYYKNEKWLDARFIEVPLELAHELRREFLAKKKKARKVNNYINRNTVDHSKNDNNGRICIMCNANECWENQMFCFSCYMKQTSVEKKPVSKTLNYGRNEQQMSYHYPTGQKKKKKKKRKRNRIEIM